MKWTTTWRWTICMPLACLLIACALIGCVGRVQAQDIVILPKHITPQAQASIKKGLDFLAKHQSEDGSFSAGRDGAAYPVAMSALAGMAFLANGNTPSRGPYADNVSKLVDFLVGNAQPTGLITGPTQEQGYAMYGHGFSTMFLASCYGMESNDRLRERMKKIINAAVRLTGSASSNGGWCYMPGTGDEGSVTVTQIQGLRAASNAGFSVPKGIIEGGVHYLEMCKSPEGGICYNLGSAGSGAHLPISAAAVATLYNAGQYDSTLANSCLDYLKKQMDIQGDPFANNGHAYYTNFYAAQAFYQAGDKYWDPYFPNARDRLIKMQSKDGSWPGDWIGETYGTSIALVILQLPYKYLPIYQR